MRRKIKTVPMPEAAEAIAEAVGAKPGDTIEIAAPQFTRTPDMPASACPPGSSVEWSDLKKMTVKQLKELGCGNWDGRLMLFPGEWYHHIPAGYEVEGISGNKEAFIAGVTDDDIRFGCLPYGVPAVDGKVEVED